MQFACLTSIKINLPIWINLFIVKWKPEENCIMISNTINFLVTEKSCHNIISATELILCIDSKYIDSQLCILMILFSLLGVAFLLDE